jgi:hypothetical protein
MNELSDVLADATRSIEAEYFHLSIDGGGPVYRERVYCYELYHQMRNHWPRGCPFYLNGEIDKAAHPKLANLGADHAKPDLLVHQPGYMRGNHAIIEVKSPRATIPEIRKDLNTLSIFVNRVGYQRAIYLHYGYEADSKVVERVNRVASLMENIPAIEIWVHSEVGQPAQQVHELKSNT